LHTSRRSLELEQLSTGTTAAQTGANAAAEEFAASATALERANAKQTVAIDADEQAAVIAAVEAAAIVTSPEEEIRRLPLTLKAEQASTAGCHSRLPKRPPLSSTACNGTSSACSFFL
jgi:hypothetical protein